MVLMEDSVVAVWLRLADFTAKSYARDERSPTVFRPPSLRDACYAYVLSVRTATDSDPETMESFVNGLELGAISALRTAWELHRLVQEAGKAAERGQAAQRDPT